MGKGITMKIRLNLLRCFEATEQIRRNIGDSGLVQLVEYYISGLGYNVGKVTSKYHYIMMDIDQSCCLFLKEVLEEAFLFTPPPNEVRVSVLLPYLYEAEII